MKYKENQKVYSEYRGNGVILEVNETSCLIKYNDGPELLTSFDLMDEEITIVLEKTPKLKDCFAIKIARQIDSKVELTTVIDNITPFNTKDGYCGFCINPKDLNKLKIIACGKGWDFHGITHNEKVLFSKKNQKNKWFLISKTGEIQFINGKERNDLLNGKDI